MRLPRLFTAIRLIVWMLAFTLSASAQSSLVGGPLLGFMPDGAGSTVSPILGIPGASFLGNPVALDTSFRNAVISPRQDYAIAERSEDGLVVFVDLRTDAPAAVVVNGTRPAEHLIGISPSGATAAIYDGQSRSVQVVGNLPVAPSLVSEFDASQIVGNVSSLAISDDGTIAILGVSDGTNSQSWTISAEGVSLVQVDHPKAIAFFVGLHNIVVTDDVNLTAVIIQDASHTAVQIPLIAAGSGMTGFSNVAVSDDSQRVFVADNNSGTIAAVDVGTGQTTLLSCQCKPTGFYRLNGTSIFRLTDSSSGPVKVLDASDVQPRIVIVPPKTFEDLHQ